MLETAQDEARARMIDRHVRADITTLTSVIGLSPATDFSRTIGGLCSQLKDRQPRGKRAHTAPDRTRFYLVTEALAGHLQARDALCATFEDLNIWLRVETCPLIEDLLLSGFAPDPPL